jgi:hypothetical protein
MATPVPYTSRLLVRGVSSRSHIVSTVTSIRLQGVLIHRNFGTLLILYPELAANSVSEERGGKEETLYFSVVDVAKSVRERCILVAAIVIVISEGNRNICIADEHDGLPYVISSKNAQG